MKLRGKNSGRRGRKFHKPKERLARTKREREKEKQQYREEQETWLKRILPKLRKFCPLSSIGLVCDKKEADNPRHRDYFSIDGPVTADIIGGKLYGVWKPRPWLNYSPYALKEIAKVKHWHIALPKNPLLVLAEAADGRYDG